MQRSLEPTLEISVLCIIIGEIVVLLISECVNLLMLGRFCFFLLRTRPRKVLLLRVYVFVGLLFTNTVSVWLKVYKIRLYVVCSTLPCDFY